MAGMHQMACRALLMYPTRVPAAIVKVQISHPAHSGSSLGAPPDLRF